MPKHIRGLFVFIAVATASALATETAGASSRLYDMSFYLQEAGAAPATTVSQDLATAENAPAPLSVDAPQMAARGESKGLGGFLSEIRVGVLKHDLGPFSRTEETGVDANIELLFVSPDFLDFVWSPRPHLGVSVNSDGDTSQAYFGLSWEFDVWRDLFVGFSFGGSVHNGETTTNRTDRKELGCRLLFRESAEAGWRFARRHAVTVFLDHISNADLCDRNEGLENFGVRYGYRF